MTLFPPASSLSSEIVDEAESGKLMLTVSPLRALSFPVFSIPVACVLALNCTTQDRGLESCRVARPSLYSTPSSTEADMSLGWSPPLQHCSAMVAGLIVLS